MTAQAIRLVILLGALYIFAGIMAWPAWWYEALQGSGGPFGGGGLQYLIFMATGPYLFLNILVLGLIGVCVAALEYGNAKGKPAALRVVRHLASPAYFGLVSILIIVAGFRLQLVGLNSFVAPPSTETESVSSPVQLPVDFVWLDETRIKLAYEQIAPAVRLTGTTVKAGEKDTLEGGATAGAASAKGVIERSGERTQTFSAGEQSISRTTVDLINGLYERKQLRRLTTIESQSGDVKALEDAAATLRDKFKVAVNEPQLAAARRALVEKNIEKDLPAELKEASWVLIIGDMVVSQEPQRTRITFEYVPALPGKAVFSCVMPKGAQSGDLPAIADKSIWRFSMFGRLLQSPSSAADGNYNVQCYALYR